MFAAVPTPTLTLRPCAIPFQSAGSRRRTTTAPLIKASVSTAVALAGREEASLYEILRVKRTASLMEIKTAYRSLAKVYHPDAASHVEQPSSDGLDFIEIHNAYETLSDPAARAVYDLSLANSCVGGGYYRERSWRRPVGFSGGYCPTRRWETDQCW